MTNRNELINFHPQPDFPAEDISESNAYMTSHYLRTSRESDTYLDTYQRTLQLIHKVGNGALTFLDRSPGDNRAEYQAFCHGFTTIDYVATLLDSRPFKQIATGKGLGFFYLHPGDFADVELAKRIDDWRETHERTLELLLESSDRRGESSKQFQARLVGAQVASEVLYVA